VRRDANRYFFKKLAKAAEREEVLYGNGPYGDAVAEWTRQRMYRRLHVPLRYYLPDADPAALSALTAELAAKGHIDLDAAGEPCALSGRPPVVKEAE
jgi:hypothetical protein